MEIKQLPYGIADFKRIRTEGYYYVDKTMYLEHLESENSYLSLLRPRRFGKSLLLSMMEAYYDIKMKDRFQELFGDLYVGSHPTKWANQFQVMRFDFSRIKGTEEQLENNFRDYICERLDDFLEKYGEYYNERIHRSVASTNVPENKLNYITGYASRMEYRLYLIIDEYDNFTNEVLSSKGKEKMSELLHAEGFYRQFFKLFKGAFSRIFLTGISPVTLDDLTSGYNIDWDISHIPYFNGIVGFEEKDVREILNYYKKNVGMPGCIDEIIDDMRPWYDNYCFAYQEYGKETIFNCDMILYYMKPMLKLGIPPQEMVDKNLRTDYKKLEHLVNIDRGLQRNDRLSDIEKISNDGYIDMRLKDSFPALSILERENYRSLLYYYGMLTIGSDNPIMQHMIIPNECVRSQYWHFLVHMYNTEVHINVNQLSDLFFDMVFNGNWEPVIKKIGEIYYELSSVRDSRGGEFNQHGFFKAMLGMCDVTVLCPELELNYGYSDFVMLPLLNHTPTAKHAYIFELKYVLEDASEKEEVKQYEEAENQIKQYAASKRLQRFIKGCTLHGITILFRGHKMESPISILEVNVS